MNKDSLRFLCPWFIPLPSKPAGHAFHEVREPWGWIYIFLWPLLLSQKPEFQQSPVQWGMSLVWEAKTRDFCLLYIMLSSEVIGTQGPIWVLTMQQSELQASILLHIWAQNVSDQTCPRVVKHHVIMLPLFLASWIFSTILVFDLSEHVLWWEDSSLNL